MELETGRMKLESWILIEVFFWGQMSCPFGFGLIYSFAHEGTGKSV